MAVPAAPTEAGGNGILFLTHDVGGTNTPGILRGVRPRTVNGTILSYTGIATHADADAWTANDPVVLGAVYDPTGAGAVRKLLGDASGRIVPRPLGVYDSGGSNAFGHPRLIGQDTLNSEARGWLGFATHKDGDTFVQATDGVVVLAGVVQSGNAVKDIAVDASGRVVTDEALSIGGNGATAVSGTRAQLRSSTACRKVRVVNNTAAVVYVGNSTVTADTNASTGGYQLVAAGSAVDVETTNTNLVYVIGTTGSVSYIWWT